ncbi:hypothetical protein [Adlercreutzia sp. ZJ154]|uniref:Nmad3 family putative nucleotide modification protein n=1 Tax=Adlercreutzia sp. ZJ154 TaxID=2709790 RepID=UPI002103D646|nr:hypothetical protein [Adlercreutzia sp. ZJ154]
MKVEEKLDRPEGIERYPWHPHCKNNNRPNNRLYVPSEHSTFKLNETDENNKNSDSLVLTLEGQNKMTLWKLEPFFADERINISWQGGRRAELKDGYAILRVAPFGQEIVVSTDDAGLQKQLAGWVNGLIALAADTR